jgi:hypothetical protein
MVCFSFLSLYVNCIRQEKTIMSVYTTFNIGALAVQVYILRLHTAACQGRYVAEPLCYKLWPDVSVYEVFGGNLI